MSLYAKDFEINELVIESVNGTELSIRDIMGEINVFESIFSNTISASIFVDDANNEIKNCPITGHEWIRISFNTPAKDNIELRLRIYKISARELEKDRRQMFILHCIDGVELTNSQTRVSKAYKGKLISDIATDVQENFLGSSFLNIETTQNLFHIIPGFWTPFKTLNFLASRATSTQQNGANYVYFQTCKGFSFTSLETLFQQDAKIRYLYGPANIRDPKSVVGHAPRTLETDMVSIQSYRIVNNFDTLDNASKGMYNNKLLWHNIHDKTFGETDFSYEDSYTDYKHIEPNQVTGGSSMLWTSQSDFDGEFGAFKFYTTGQPGGQESHVDTWMQQRISQMQQIQNLKMFATIPGDSSRVVGDIVEVWLPSPEAIVDKDLQMDAYYMGRYLITGLQHRLVKANYSTILELAKDSIFTAFP